MSKLNGIYIEYHDSLSMDAFRAWVYKDGVNILATDHELLKSLTNNSEYQLDNALRNIKHYGGYNITMVRSCSYYHTIGLIDAIKIIKSKYPELNIFAFDMGWYTFPQEWRSVKNFFTNLTSDSITMIDGKSEDYFKTI